MTDDWPREFREHRIGNFRPSLAERNAKRPKRGSQRPGMSGTHLELIRLMPCSACLKVNGKSDPHHLKSLGAKAERGVGLKATDRWAVPLCRSCHNEIEAISSPREPKWFADFGVADVHELAHALWHATGDLGRMIKVLMAHRGHK